MTKRKLLLVALAIMTVTCAGALLTAPPGSTLTLLANPRFVPANGGISVLTAFITEPAGTTVPDGTNVLFFTNLGRVDPPQAKTKNGSAHANFISDSRSGVADITAVSGGAAVGPPAPSPSPNSTSPGNATPPITANAATATVQITVGGAQSLSVIMTADPSRITESRSTHVFATVIDVNGNPVQNIGVIFTVPGGLEFMDSQGNPIFTDTNGRAEDVLRTRRTPPVNTSVTVTATALAAGTPSASVTVPIFLP
jgi:hypothetical protein